MREEGGVRKMMVRRRLVDVRQVIGNEESCRCDQGEEEESILVKELHSHSLNPNPFPSNNYLVQLDRWGLIMGRTRLA